MLSIPNRISARTVKGSKALIVGNDAPKKAIALGAQRSCLKTTPISVLVVESGVMTTTRIGSAPQSEKRSSRRNQKVHDTAPLVRSTYPTTSSIPVTLERSLVVRTANVPESLYTIERTKSRESAFIAQSLLQKTTSGCVVLVKRNDVLNTTQTSKRGELHPESISGESDLQPLKHTAGQFVNVAEKIILGSSALITSKVTELVTGGNSRKSLGTFLTYTNGSRKKDTRKGSKLCVSIAIWLKDIMGYVHTRLRETELRFA